MFAGCASTVVCTCAVMLPSGYSVSLIVWPALVYIAGCSTKANDLPSNDSIQFLVSIMILSVRGILSIPNTPMAC